MAENARRPAERGAVVGELVHHSLGPVFVTVITAIRPSTVIMTGPLPCWLMALLRALGFPRAARQPLSSR
jgi:hypothetical protein